MQNNPELLLLQQNMALRQIFTNRGLDLQEVMEFAPYDPASPAGAQAVYPQPQSPNIKTDALARGFRPRDGYPRWLCQQTQREQPNII